MRAPVFVSMCLHYVNFSFLSVRACLCAHLRAFGVYIAHSVWFSLLPRNSLTRSGSWFDMKDVRQNITHGGRDSKLHVIMFKAILMPAGM